jgi:LAS superfamily LD-carboxypeptidase LdcB
MAELTSASGGIIRMNSADLDRLLVGQDPEPMVAFRASVVHRDIIPALTRLTQAAAEDGIELTVASGFRDFDRQCAIWNGKARGERTLLDELERPIRAETLTPEERMFAILRWSALPGSSRHHWGTDIDVFDRAALPQGNPELRRHETTPGAVFGRLHAWLDGNVERLGFYRPYDRDRGGVSPEPWHLSHVDLGHTLHSAYRVELLERVVRGGGLELADSVLRHIEEIYVRFVDNVARAPASPIGSAGVPVSRSERG